MRIFILGFMGSGKSFWGKKWSEAYNIPHYDLDEIISEEKGESITHLFERIGESSFRKIEQDALHKLLQKDNYILSCGGGTPCFFDNMEKMNEAGKTVYIKTTPGEVMSRVIREIEKRPLIKNIPPGELLSFIQNKLAEREPYYLKAKHVLDDLQISEHSLDQVIKNSI